MTQNGNGNHGDILSLLTPERRAEIIAEALSGAVRNLLESADKTLGKLIEELQAHPNWDDLKGLPAGLVLGHSVMPPPASDLPELTLVRPKTTETKAKTSKPQLKPVKKALLHAEDAILDAINNGKDVRGVDVMKATGLPQKIVTLTLAKLRGKKRIKGRGHGRGMMYTVTA